MKSKEQDQRLTYSYLHLRKAVGWIGMLLPFVLILGLWLLFSDEETPTSISHYYHTSIRSVFVGALCAVALFMFFYTGYTKTDNILGNITGLFAIGVAWFPATEMAGETDTIGIVHYICAAIFFLSLASFSLFLFTKTGDKLNMTPRKKARNKVYITCGIIMIICLMAIAVYKMFGLHPSIVFWSETIALIAFGISWLTKGETIFPDKNAAIKINSL